MKHTFERYCKDYESIENYYKAKADNFKGWHCHHRLETHTSDGERRLVDITQKELIALNMYYHRPAEELIFLPRSEHEAFRKGKPRSAETRKKLSELNKGNKYGLGNTNVRGRHWYNNGQINALVYECPEGFVPGILR